MLPPRDAVDAPAVCGPGARLGAGGAERRVRHQWPCRNQQLLGVGHKAYFRAVCSLCLIITQFQF